MKGLIFILVTYLIVVVVCSAIKIIAKKIKGSKTDIKKESEQKSASKIYYITNTKQRKTPIKKVTPDIAIKGSIIEKTDNDF